MWYKHTKGVKYTYCWEDGRVSPNKMFNQPTGLQRELWCWERHKAEKKTSWLVWGWPWVLWCLFSLKSGTTNCRMWTKTLVSWTLRHPYHWHSGTLWGRRHCSLSFLPEPSQLHVKVHIPHISALPESILCFMTRLFLQWPNTNPACAQPSSANPKQPAPSSAHSASL